MKPASPAARSHAHGVLSLAFADPAPELLRELRRRAPALGAGLDAGLDAPVRALTAAIQRLRLPRWRAAHVKCFGYAISKECPPYEAEYDQANLFQKTQTLADIAGFYRAFGLQTAAQLHDRTDHLSVELEFMQFLCFKEAHAAARGEPAQRVAQCRAAQAKFLAEHLGVWAGGFARRLQAVAGGGVYAALATLLESFLAAEATLLGVRIGAGGRLNEAPDAPEPACAAQCGGAPGSARIEVFHERA